MTIRIINTCNQFCLHCMQQSGPNEKDIMSLETFQNTLEFINSTSTKLINISGGEPTLHPELLDFLKLAIKYNKEIVLLTNGSYLLNNPKLRHEIFILMLKHKNLSIQVTSVKNIYSNFTHQKDFEKELKPLLIYKKVKDRIVYVNTLENGIVPVGRALNNLTKLTEQIRTTSEAPRCFNLYNALRHFKGNLIETISYVKQNSSTSLCIPLVIENGDMLFGEYGNTCNVVWNVNNTNKNPILKIEDLNGPCGACYVSKKQEGNVNIHLACYPNKHNKITDSYLYKIEFTTETIVPSSIKYGEYVETESRLRIKS